MSSNANAPAAPMWCNETNQQLYGLTTREYFIAAALQGLCARSSQSLNMRQRAAKAVEYADLALAEAERTT